jgi:hypothetical protein
MPSLRLPPPPAPEPFDPSLQVLRFLWTALLGLVFTGFAFYWAEDHPRPPIIGAYGYWELFLFLLSLFSANTLVSALLNYLRKRY